MHIIWFIIIGIIVGVVAKWLSPSPNNPQGFILTAILGIVGSFVGTFLGRLLHFYGPNDDAGFIMSIIGAVLVLIGWHTIVQHRSRS